MKTVEERLDELEATVSALQGATGTAGAADAPCRAVVKRLLDATGEVYQGAGEDAKSLDPAAAPQI